MFDPDSSLRRSHRWVVALVLLPALLLAGCGGRLISRTEAEPLIKQPIKELPKSLPFWLGNPRRNFYGTGPWQPGPLEIVWELETSLIKGKLHKDLWGGTSWPGQPSVVGSRVYFPSADGNVYCVNRNDGSIVWKYTANDSFKATPTVIGDRIIASVYCFRKLNGEPVWKFKADGGFSKNYKERSGFWASPVVLKDRLYIGSNNGFMYCLSADKGELVWKHLVRAPIWGTAPVIDGRLVFGDKAGWIYVLSVEDGKRLAELKIGDNINSTPAVLEGRIFIGAFNGNLYCLGTKSPGWQEAEGITK